MCIRDRVGTGIVVRRNAEEMFEQRVQSLMSSLKEQMELYEAEQRTLQVLVDICTTRAYVTGVMGTRPVGETCMNIAV